VHELVIIGLDILMHGLNMKFSNQWFVQYNMSELLRDLIALKLFLKRVEYICEEARDVDGIYVVLQNQRWLESSKYCWSFT
jgi:hypothetical protein